MLSLSSPDVPAEGVAVAQESDADLLALWRAKRPDVPLSEAPPGRDLLAMSTEQLQVVLLAVEGLTQQLQLRLHVTSPRHPQYADLAGMTGAASVIANQLRRYLAQASG